MFDWLQNSAEKIGVASVEFVVDSYFNVRQWMDTLPERILRWLQSFLLEDGYCQLTLTAEQYELFSKDPDRLLYFFLNQFPVKSMEVWVITTSSDAYRIVCENIVYLPIGN